MALILLGAAAYGAYVAAQKGDGNDELEIDLEGKTSITLLPLEQTLGMLETPMSTITYFDGDYRVAAKHLMQRVPDVIALNPWMGGCAGRAKGEKEVKLWFDESGKDSAPGTFYMFSPGEVPLMHDTPYEKYEELGKEQNLERTMAVPPTAEIVGKNQALWRVSVVPTADKPESKFVVIVSMSRLLGDPYTFYSLYNMLSEDMEPIRMNPIRRLEFSEALTSHMGKEEAFYINKITTNPLWEWTKTEEDPTERLMFLISEDWLAEHRGDAPADEEAAERNAATNALLTSWFFNQLRPTVGLMAYDYRNTFISSRLSGLDAGNYCHQILYTPVDYATPDLIRSSEKSQRRCGTDPPAPLPGNKWDATFSVTTNWSAFHWDSLSVGEGAIMKLHLPLFGATGLKVVPNKLSVLFLFTAKPGSEDGSVKRQLGALVVAPRSGIARVVGSGVVGEVIAKF